MGLHRLLMIGIVAMGTRCGGSPAGSPCEVTGDGFTRQDPCHHSCIDWEITCEDGSTVVPQACSGGECQTDADCGSGLVCTSVGSFSSECLPADTCEG